MSFYNELQKSDWLGRSPEDYTYEKSGLSIGWEETLKDGEALSRFLLKVNSKNLKADRKIHLAKQVCTNILSSMNVHKKNLRISFTNELKSYQKDNHIQVSLAPLDGTIKFPSFNHELDPILGFCVHETAHSLYTDEEYDRYLNKFSGEEQKTKAFIMNSLEDERIEQKVAGVFRGYTGYIGKAKDYVFGKLFEEQKAKMNVDEQEDIVQLVQTFLHLLRYPKALDENLVNKFEGEIKEIMGILENYPETIQDMTKCTEDIYKVFEKFHNQQQQQQSDQQGDGDGQDQNESDDQQDQENQDDNGSGKGKNSKSKKDKSDKDKKQNSGGSGDDEQDEQDQEEGEGKGDDKNEQEDENSDQNGDGNDQQDGEDGDEEKDDSSGDGNDDGEEDDNSGDGGGNDGQPSMSELLEGLLEAANNSQPQVGDKDQTAKMVKGDKYRVAEALEQVQDFDNADIEARTSCAHTFPITENLNTSELSVLFQDAEKVRSSSNNYDRALAEVRTYASSLRAKIQQLNRNQIITNTGLYEGDFDDGLLVDALVGAKNVYKEQHKMLNQGACVGLLIDESGSMGGSKWFEAMKIAVMFERALEGVNNVDFYCYGHTTGGGYSYHSDNSTVINVYYEGRKKSDRKVLGKIYAHNTNRDGHAILETVGRMRKQVPQEMPIILFMISDGEPSASVPYGYNGTTYTKKCVNTVEKYANTQVIHIAIEQGIPSADMFNTYVEFSDHRKLVRDIGGLLKDIMTKQQRAIVL